MSKKIARPSSKPGAADVPLVDQGRSREASIVGRRVVAAVLRVDHDFRAGPRLDRMDRRLGRGDRARR